MASKKIDIPLQDVILKGDLFHPKNSGGLIIFSHGSGSSRLSPRNRSVADYLKEKGFSTLLFDLLTPIEDQKKKFRFDIQLQSNRLIHVTKWIKDDARFKKLNTGFFGASTGAAAAIQAASMLGEDIIQAIVSRGGRPDLAKKYLSRLSSPILLIVGELDEVVLELNEIAYNMISCPKELTLIPNATHLFEEPGTLEEVTYATADWFRRYLYWPTIQIKKEFIDER